MRLQALVERTVKSIVVPAAADRCRNAHQSLTTEERPWTRTAFLYTALTKSASIERLRANHHHPRTV